jgi:hypothetical protein
VTARLAQALESPRPSPRYYVTWPTWIAAGLRRVLWTRDSDRLIGGN